MSFRKFAASGALALFIAVAIGQAQADQSVNVKDDDPSMLAAFSKARASLDDFLDKWHHPATGTENYSVKIGIADTGNGFAVIHADDTIGKQAEFFWMTDMHQDGSRFTATVGNDPDTIHNIRGGQTIQFGMADIVDWMYLQNGKIKGNFTACPALKNASEDERRQMADQFGLSCN